MTTSLDQTYQQNYITQIKLKINASYVLNKIPQKKEVLLTKMSLKLKNHFFLVWVINCSLE